MPALPHARRGAGCRPSRTGAGDGIGPSAIEPPWRTAALHGVSDDVAASPCRGTCTYDAVRGLCLDCSRLGSEIAEWLTASRARRMAIRAAAAARLATR